MKRRGHEGKCWRYTGYFNEAGAYIPMKSILPGCCKGCKRRHFSPPGGQRKWDRLLREMQSRFVRE